MKTITINDFNALSEQDKNTVYEKLYEIYISKYDKDFFEDYTINYFNEIGITNIETEYNISNRKLDLKILSSYKDINMRSLIKALELYCYINSEQKRILLEEYEDPDFSLDIKYNTNNKYNYCDVQANDIIAISALEDKLIEFLDEYIELLNGEFKGTLNLLNDNTILLNKWKEDKFEITIKEYGVENAY